MGFLFELDLVSVENMGLTAYSTWGQIQAGELERMETVNWKTTQ